MADPVRIMALGDPAPPDRAGEAQPSANVGFGAALDAHVAASPAHHHHAARAAAAHGAATPAVAHAHAAHHPATHHAWKEKTTAVISAPVQQALAQAMRLEQVPASWHVGLQFIMAQESAGRVGARNHVDTARGLFQLTRASYALNPNGAGSFGNAVEEAQGGIRYIRERYGTADNAAGFWRQRRWY